MYVHTHCSSSAFASWVLRPVVLFSGVSDCWLEGPTQARMPDQGCEVGLAVWTGSAPGNPSSAIQERDWLCGSEQMIACLSCFFMFFCYWPPRDLLSRWTFCMLACLYICMDPKCLYASSSFSRCCWQRQPCFDHARNSHVIARYADYDCKRCRLLGRRRCSHISAALLNLDSRNVQLKIPASRNYAWTTGREEGKESKCQDKEDRSHCCRVLRPYKLPPNLLGCGGLRSHCCRVLQPYKWPPSPLGCGGL